MSSNRSCSLNPLWLFKRLFWSKNAASTPAEPHSPVIRIPPAEPPASLKEAEDRILLRHLQQLRQPDVKKMVLLERTSTSTVNEKSASTGATLQIWTEDSLTQISEAKKAYTSHNSPSDLDLNIALLALMESTAMYLRDFPAVKSAVTAEDDADAERLLLESQQGIISIANTWGIGFSVLCDLVQDHPETNWGFDGPFSGAFYSLDAKNPFIVVAFKGTTWWEIGEWDVDVHFQAVRTSGGVLYDTTVSNGVYTALFTEYKIGQGQLRPFDYIIAGITDIALTLTGTTANPVPVYVTGHSLGASYATLFYAESLRLFGVGTTTPQAFVIRDLQNFGSPRIGLADFGQALDSATATSKTHTWRIADDRDLVPSIPPVDSLEQPFNHIDQGVRVSATAQPALLRSEVGKGLPTAYATGTVAAHASNLAVLRRNQVRSK